MTNNVADTAHRNRARLANKALKASAKFWFLTAIIGQWIFVLYVIGLYGRLTLRGGLPAWVDPNVPNGYVPGDEIGNMAAAAHILVAIIVQGGGPLQLIPYIRNRFPTFHHWNGRAFISAAVVASITGLYLVWVRGSMMSPLDAIANTIVAVLLFFFGAMALRYAIGRDIYKHRRWALRLFMIANAVWFVRLGVYEGIFLSRAFGIDFRSIAGVYMAFWDIGKIVIPLGILEIYLLAQIRDNIRAKLATATLLVVATFATALGIYSVTTIAWLPRVLGVQ